MKNPGKLPTGPGFNRDSKKFYVSKDKELQHQVNPLTLVFDFAIVVSDMQFELLEYRKKFPDKTEQYIKAEERLDRLKVIMDQYGKVFFDMQAYRRRAIDTEGEKIRLVEIIKHQEAEIKKLTNLLNYVGESQAG